MKHSEVITLKNKLSLVTGLVGFTTKISIRRNIARIETAIKPLNEEEKEIGLIIKDYRDELTEINRRLSEGKLKRTNISGQTMEYYDVPESKKAEQKKEIDELETKHKEAISKYEEKIKIFQKYLQETESSFKPIMIPMAQIEEFDQAISQESLDAIWPLLSGADPLEKEEEEKEEKLEETK